MPQTKASMIFEIKMAMANIGGYHERLNMKKGHLYIHEEAETFPADWIRTAHKWIMGIYREEFQTYINTRKLLPEEIWTRYERWGGFDDHAEVVQLKEHTHALRSKLVSQKRPDFFRKGKANAGIKKQKRKHERTKKNSGSSKKGGK